MLRPLESSDKTWLGSYANDFHSRFLSLLAYRFRTFDPVTALSINESASSGARLDPSYEPAPFTKESLDQILTPFDLKRLAAYANNILDYHVICEYTCIPPPPPVQEFNYFTLTSYMFWRSYLFSDLFGNSL